MRFATGGPGHPDPDEQGRFGQDVEDVLHLLASLAQWVRFADDAEESRRAADMATFAARQFPALSDRRREIGQLCPGVEWELMLAESVIAALNMMAITCAGDEPGRPASVSDEDWEIVLPRMPRSEAVESIMRLVNVIGLQFPGDTARRWKEIARASTRCGCEREEKRMLL